MTSSPFPHYFLIFYCIFVLLKLLPLFFNSDVSKTYISHKQNPTRLKTLYPTRLDRVNYIFWTVGVVDNASSIYYTLRILDTGVKMNNKLIIRGTSRQEKMGKARYGVK